MAKIHMTSGFNLIPEGTYVFRVYDATYDEEFGKIEVKLVNAEGMTHTERFSIKNANDELNEKALNAFSYFAKTVMGDFSLEDIDPEELVNHFIRAEVVHTKVQSNKDPNKTVTFANLGDKSPADDFDTTPGCPRTFARQKRKSIRTANDEQSCFDSASYKRAGSGRPAWLGFVYKLAEEER